MRIVLFLLSILAFLAGAGILVAAQGALHEIEGFVLFLISAVFLIGASIVETVVVARKRLETTVQSLVDTIKKTNRVPVSAPAIAPERHEYFCSIDGASSGPYTVEEMRQFRQNGRIHDETLIFRKGDSEWRPVREFTEIIS